MTLSIDDLRVDSYATQLSELELTELKGGVTPAAILPYLGYAAVAATVYVVGSVITTAINADNDHKECSDRVTTVTTTGPNGEQITTTTKEHICRE